MYEEIPITGLYGIRFLIVKIKDDKYVLYQGDSQKKENFVGVYSNVDNLFEGVVRKCKREARKNDKGC